MNLLKKYLVTVSIFLYIYSDNSVLATTVKECKDALFKHLFNREECKNDQFQSPDIIDTFIDYIIDYIDVEKVKDDVSKQYISQLYGLLKAQDGCTVNDFFAEHNSEFKNVPATEKLFSGLGFSLENHEKNLEFIFKKWTNETLQRGNTDEQKGNTDEQKGNTDEQKGNTDEQKGNTDEQKGNTDEQKGNTDEQKGNTDEQKGLTDEQKKWVLMLVKHFKDFGYNTEKANYEDIYYPDEYCKKAYGKKRTKN